MSDKQIKYKIAAALKKAIELESKEYNAFDTGGWGKGSGIRDKHMFTACKEHGIEEIWYILMLGSHWVNDIDDWITAVEEDRVDQYTPTDCEEDE